MEKDFIEELLEEVKDNLKKQKEEGKKLMKEFQRRRLFKFW